MTKPAPEVRMAIAEKLEHAEYILKAYADLSEMIDEGNLYFAAHAFKDALEAARKELSELRKHLEFVESMYKQCKETKDNWAKACAQVEKQRDDLQDQLEALWMSEDVYCDKHPKIKMKIGECYRCGGDGYTDSDIDEMNDPMSWHSDGNCWQCKGTGRGFLECHVCEMEAEEELEEST
jgi:hypothetical protein